MQITHRLYFVTHFACRYRQDPLQRQLADRPQNLQIESLDLPHDTGLHCNKKGVKRSSHLENNPLEEGKFPCGYWNIFPGTHTVFIPSSVREKCSRLWMGTFYLSKKVNFLELSFLTAISGKFPDSVFLKDISGKFPHSRGKNVLGAIPLLGSFLKSLPYKQKT